MDRNEVPNQRNPEDAYMMKTYLIVMDPRTQMLQEEAMDDTGDHRVEDANSDKGRPHDLPVNDHISDRVRDQHQLWQG